MVVLALLLTQRADAEQRMAVVGGVGFTFPAIQKDPEAPKVQGIGGYAEASYYYRFSDWVRPMVYSGLHVTVPNQDCGHDFLDCDVSAQYFYTGGQVRLIAPIPYFGLFVESGVGGSLGRFSTHVGDRVNEELTGFAYHIPVSLGVLLGEHHEFQLQLRYIYHPDRRQVSGGLGFGFDFRLAPSKMEKPLDTSPTFRLQRSPG